MDKYHFFEVDQSEIWDKEEREEVVRFFVSDRSGRLMMGGKQLFGLLRTQRVVGRIGGLWDENDVCVSTGAVLQLRGILSASQVLLEMHRTGHRFV